MLILKSFFRKLTTKNYLILAFLISCGFMVLFFLKEYYIKLFNNNYDGSMLIFEISKEKKLDIKNVKKCYQALILEQNDINPIISVNNTKIDDNEVLLPNSFKEIYTLGSNISFEYNEEKINLKVSDYYNNDYSIQPFLINFKTLENITKKSNTVSYVVNLKNWYLQEKTIKEIESKFNTTVVSYISKKNNISYEKIIFTINIFILIILGLFIIINIILLLNMISDEKQTHNLYLSLGFSKKKVNKFLFIKICLLILISLIPMIILLLSYFN